MVRNAIESDFRSSKMAAKGHFVKNSKQITLLATFDDIVHNPIHKLRWYIQLSEYVFV